MLKFYTGFEINDQTGNALTEKEMTTLHYDRITSLQVYIVCPGDACSLPGLFWFCSYFTPFTIFFTDLFGHYCASGVDLRWERAKLVQNNSAIYRTKSDFCSYDNRRQDFPFHNVYP